MAGNRLNGCHGTEIKCLSEIQSQCGVLVQKRYHKIISTNDTEKNVETETLSTP